MILVAFENGPDEKTLFQTQIQSPEHPLAEIQTAHLDGQWSQ